MKKRRGSMQFKTDFVILYFTSSGRSLAFFLRTPIYVIAGQLALLLETYAAGRIHNPTPAWLWPKLRVLHDDAHNISQASLAILQKDDPEYFNQMQWLVSRPMKFAKDYQRVDPGLRWPSSIMKKTGKFHLTCIYVMLILADCIFLWQFGHDKSITAIINETPCRVISQSNGSSMFAKYLEIFSFGPGYFYCCIFCQNIGIGFIWNTFIVPCMFHSLWYNVL